VQDVVASLIFGTVDIQDLAQKAITEYSTASLCFKLAFQLKSISTS
jgi:hypothetical protein